MNQRPETRTASRTGTPANGNNVYFRGRLFVGRVRGYTFDTHRRQTTRGNCALALIRPSFMIFEVTRDLAGVGILAEQIAMAQSGSLPRLVRQQPRIPPGNVVRIVDAMQTCSDVRSSLYVTLE